jgi:bacillithiol system protein YtxJ
MDWISLKELRQLDEILIESQQAPVLIFKHSTRCNVSRATFDRLERKWDASEMGSLKHYFLDLISFREISNSIAERFNVEHHSPQVLVISKGKSVLDLSHFDIDYGQIKSVCKIKAC